MKYFTVTSWNQNDFNIACTEMLQKGWEPVGGVSITIDQSNGMHFAQAFIKKA